MDCQYSQDFRYHMLPLISLKDWELYRVMILVIGFWFQNPIRNYSYDFCYVKLETYLLSGFLLIRLLRIFLWRSQWWKLKLRAFLFQNYGMHPIHWTISVTPWEKLLTFDCACDYIANQRVFLWKICGEVHLLPFKLLSNTKPRKSKVWSNCLSFDKVE